MDLTAPIRVSLRASSAATDQIATQTVSTLVITNVSLIVVIIVTNALPTVNPDAVHVRLVINRAHHVRSLVPGQHVDNNAISVEVLVAHRAINATPAALKPLVNLNVTSVMIVDQLYHQLHHQQFQLCLQYIPLLLTHPIHHHLLDHQIQPILLTLPIPHTLRIPH